MNVRLFAIAVVLWLLQVEPLMAAQALLREIIYQDTGESYQLEVRLGISAEIASKIDVDSGTFKIRLNALGESRTRAWASEEMYFDEADRLLQRVSLQGSGERGFEMLLEFVEPVTVQMLPQYAQNQVLLKFASQRAYRKLVQPDKADDQTPLFAINLESRLESLPGLRDIPESFARTHRVYITEFKQKGEIWQRLRLGFFTDKDQAEMKAVELRRYFPDAWVTAVGQAEMRFGNAFNINPDDQVARFSGETVEPVEAPAEVNIQIRTVTPSTAAQNETAIAGAASQWSSRPPVETAEVSQIELLTEQARSAFEAQDYDLAIGLYTKLLGIASGEEKQRALEMLGVSRELNRQLAHAKSNYESYLQDYPDGDGAARVQQRLASLLALEQPARASLKKPTRKNPQSWQVSSYVAQIYQRHNLSVDGVDSVPIDGVFSDFNFSAFNKGHAIDQEARITMSYLLDLTDSDRLKGREYQVSSAFWEGYSNRFSTAIKLGRQTRRAAGVPGRFDGASVTFHPTSRIGLGLLGGYLIDTSSDAPASNRPFMGVNAEYVSGSGKFTVAPFLMQQYIDGILDRRAVGLQAQLHTDRSSVFTLLDYDIYHSALNNATVMGNFQFGKSNLSASYEQRKSPYLTTRNALIGQSFDDLSDMEKAFLESQLQDIASDRTATSHTARLGLNTSLSERWAITADVVASDFSKTEASADVMALDSNTTLYSSVQLRSTDIYGPASYSALMLRRSESDSGATTSIYWDNRIGFGERWWVYPRFRIDQRSFDSSGDKQWTARPSLRVDYKRGPFRLEFEVGYERINREMANRDMDITGLYFRGGYRASF